MINSNWHPTSCRFAVIAVIVQILDTAFLNPSWGVVTDNVRCSSWAHWKAWIEFFSLAVRAEELRANICSKSAISLQQRLAGWPKISGKRGSPTNQKTMLNCLWTEHNSCYAVSLTVWGNYVTCVKCTQMSITLCQKAEIISNLLEQSDNSEYDCLCCQHQWSESKHYLQGEMAEMSLVSYFRISFNTRSFNGSV